MAKSFNARMADRFVKIRSDYATVNQLIHDTAVEIAEHAQQHGDCSTAQGLVMAMPASARREMLILWFKKFTPIVVKNDDKWTAAMHKPTDKLYVPFDLEAGRLTTFMTLSGANKEKAPLDFTGLFLLPQKLAKQLEKRIEDNLIDPNEVETAKALITTLKGIRVAHVDATPVPAAEGEETSDPAPEGEAATDPAAAMAQAAA